MIHRCISSVSVLALFLSGCSSTPPPPSAESQGSSSSAAVVQEGTMPVPETKEQSSSVVEREVMKETSRTITMTVESFQFTPNIITAKKGEKVKIRMTGLSGTHGFAIPDLGINTAIAAGKTVHVELPTDRAGTFTFFCSIPCGPGHKNMKGTITITE